jgi:predicted DNA-binding protein (MmcQ/YjbR family)
MHIEAIREYCLLKPFTSESMPFGDDTLVFKAAGKMFLLANLDGPLRISIKAKPEDVIERLEKYTEVIPAYHMNKQHWIAVEMENITDSSLIKNWIDNSYDLILRSLPKRKRQELKLPF